MTGWKRIPHLFVTQAIIVMVAGMAVFAPAHAVTSWPDWDTFNTRFVQADGRVIDITFDGKSTSEGQSYGLFFALVANDRPRFDALLKWTSDNLANGQLGEQLPAWLWGKRDDGNWGVKDQNSASDADLWIAYTLLEANRLWSNKRYADIADRLLAQIQRKEVVDAGSAGTLLLPGAVGFSLDKGRYRFNPSYLPGFMLHYLATHDPKGPWQAIADSYMRMAPQIFQGGVAPDNVVVDLSGTVMPDTERPPSASYDGIRVYLWAGMSGPSGKALLPRLAKYAALTRSAGVPPEKVDPVTAIPLRSSYSPIGYSGALLPFFAALGDNPARDAQLERLRTASQASGYASSTNYYDQALILFGKGWTDGQYRFDNDGRLIPKWKS